MSGLSFLYPAFLIGIAAIAIPIALHLMTREAAPQVPFSAVRFLRRIPVEDSRRRLRELLLLALRVGALVLLALAFARPLLTGATALEGMGTTIVAVDISYSMGAPGQFDRAKALARNAIQKARGRLGVITFSDTADLIVLPGPSRGEALAAVDRMQPGAGATRYAPAIALASEQIGANAGRIVLVTDLQKNGWEASPESRVPARITVDVADVGAPAGNLAVTELRPDRGGFVALVRNAGRTPIATRASLSLDGKPLEETAVTAQPGAFSEVRFNAGIPRPSTLRQAQGRPEPSRGATGSGRPELVEGRAGFAALTIDDQQGYPADNTRFVVLDPAAPQSLLAVTVLGNAASEAFYLERALNIDEEAFAQTTIGAGDLAQMTQDRLAGHAAVLLLATRGLDRRSRDLLQRHVQGGGALFVAAGPAIDADVLPRIFTDITLRARAAEDRSVVHMTPSDSRHPIFRPFGALAVNLGQVRFVRTVLVEEAPGAKILARFSDGLPALLEYTVGRGRVLYFASDLNREWNDFPVHPTFVPFVQEAMRYLTASRHLPREYLVADAPPGVRREPGVVALPSSGSPSRKVAINVDTRESDPARIGPDQLIASIERLEDRGSDVERAASDAQEDQQRWWQYGLGLMLLTLVCESALGRKM